MTCIVGIEHGGKVLIGGDSAGTSRYRQTMRADEKVFKNGEFAFGFAGSFRGGQLLRYKLSPPSFVENADLDTYMVTTFVDAVRQTLKDGGVAELHYGAEEGSTFLVGIRGRLYRVESDYQVARSVDPYMAIGCGDEMALGALFATEGIASMKPKTRVTKAIEAAAKFSAGVGGPLNFVETL